MLYLLQLIYNIWMKNYNNCNKNKKIKFKNQKINKLFHMLIKTIFQDSNKKNHNHIKDKILKRLKVK